MNSARRLTVVAAAVACVGCAPAETGDEMQVSAGPPDAMLDSALTVFLTAMKAGDATPVADVYADNAVSYSPNTAPIQGKAAIAEYNKQWFASIKVDSVAAGRDGLLSSGDLAVETGWFYFKGQVGGQPAADSGRYLNVWQRQADGSWKIVRDMANSSAPLPGVPASGGANK